MAFTNEQLERYSRHIILKEVGAKGQKKLLNSSVLIIGAGGLGSPAALYLAAAGVGTIGIADADEVDLSNLQRQIIHATKDVGKPKVLSAKESMEAIKYILGVGDLLTGYLLTYDALTMEFRKIKLPQHVKSCPVCGEHPTITELIDYEQAECDGVL